MPDKKITDLPIATTINASDLSVLVNNGADLQYNFTLLLQFLQANLNTGTALSFGTVLPQNTHGSNGDVFVNTAVGSFAQKISGTWVVVYTLPAANAADGTLLYGAGQPGAASGKNADSYINTLTGIFYQKTAGAWAQVFSMATGPQGPQGVAGTNGTNGANGNTILFGNGNPSNGSTGVDGNFYINTANYTLFGPKATGAWPSPVSLLGSAGETGPAGPAGATGATGPAGAAGAGIASGGATGQMLIKADSTDYDTAWQDNSFANITGQPADNANMATALAAKQAALGFTPENAANKNQPNGYAGLDATGKVASAQLPSYVDDVLEFVNYAALPATGETGKIYITLDTNYEYRWSGSAYVQLVASPGTTDAVPEGTTNLYFTLARVLGTILSGITFGTVSTVAATDNILQATGKLQGQITGLGDKSIPSGGTVTQILTKNSSADYDIAWTDNDGGSGITTFVASGTNSYTATTTPAISSYTNGQVFSIQFINSNTATATLNLNGLGAKSIVKNGSFPLNVNDITAGIVLILGYDGTNFQIVNFFPTKIPLVASGEKILSATNAGLQINYDILDQVISSSSLTSADFSSGIASISGMQGQYCYDSNYRYDCVGSNQWRRSALNGNLVDLYLTGIDDSAGAKTSSQLNSAFPSALIGQQTWGINYLYIKQTSSIWMKIAITTA